MTKRSLVSEWISNAVRRGLSERALKSPANAQWLSDNAQVICAEIRAASVWDDYRWLELQDIMAWRKRAIKE